jgi:hypothetical protein
MTTTKEQKKAWEEKNKDYVREYKKRYYQSHKKHIQKVHAKYRKTHKKESQEYQHSWHQEHKISKEEQRRIWIAKKKKEFLDMYGHQCSCCGESEEKFLCIDHISGQRGIKKKDTSIRAYKKAIEIYAPEIFRVLCANCNMATRWGQICPHQYQ